MAPVIIIQDRAQSPSFITLSRYIRRLFQLPAAPKDKAGNPHHHCRHYHYLVLLVMWWLCSCLACADHVPHQVSHRSFSGQAAKHRFCSQPSFTTMGFDGHSFRFSVTKRVFTSNNNHKYPGTVTAIDDGQQYVEQFRLRYNRTSKRFSYESSLNKQANGERDNGPASIIELFQFSHQFLFFQFKH